jgi:hypothetical protein
VVGGAWPFLVGGVICLVNSDNERDSVLLTSFAGALGCLWGLVFGPCSRALSSAAKFYLLRGTGGI